MDTLFPDLADADLQADDETAGDPWADIARANAEQAQATQTTWDMTIRERAAQRAAENGTTQEAEEGKILARYMQRMAAVVKQYAVIDAMHETRIEDLQKMLVRTREDIAAAEYARAQGPRIVAELNQRDALAVAEYMQTAPQFQDSKRKSWSTPYGKLSRKTQTKADSFTRAEDEEAESLLVDIYTGTDCVKTTSKALWAEIKKRLERREDGTIVDSETGEIIPPQAVQYKPGKSEDHYYVEVDGVRIDLLEATISERDADHTGGAARLAALGAEDPFWPDAE